FSQRACFIAHLHGSSEHSAVPTKARQARGAGKTAHKTFTSREATAFLADQASCTHILPSAHPRDRGRKWREAPAGRFQ
ncbi:unnamed protein product, partial [Mycena citricolor]